MNVRPSNYNEIYDSEEEEESNFKVFKIPLTDNYPMTNAQIGLSPSQSESQKQQLSQESKQSYCQRKSDSKKVDKKTKTKKNHQDDYKERKLKNKKEKYNIQFNLSKRCESEKKVNKSKPRVSDQNICKKYHTIAHRCMRKLKIYKNVESFIKKVHKRNYFIILLLIVQKQNCLDKFKVIYEQKCKQVLQKCQQIIKHSPINSKQRKKNKNFIFCLSNSLKAIQLFCKGQLLQSLKQLYDIQNMKKDSMIQENYIQLLEIDKNYKNEKKDNEKMDKDQ